MAADEVPAPAQMLQMIGGFYLSQALYVVAKLGLSTELADGPRTVGQLAAASGAQADALRRVIRALAPLGIFRTDGERVEATPLGLTLAEGHPGSVRDIALFFMETQYKPFGEFLHTVMTGEDGSVHYYGKPFMDWTAGSPAAAEIQTRAMASVTQGLKAGMFDDYSLPEGDLVADIGGADGSMICQFLAREPDRRGIVFDKPAVVPAARQVLADHRLADRVKVVSGDFFESVPQADVYILSSVLHDWDDESCLRILRSVKNAAAPGAHLVIAESVIPTGDAPHPAKLTDLAMLGLVTGRERTANEYDNLLATAGFTMERIVPPSPAPFSFIEAALQ
jgi:precorrin-6B methylase 2